MLNPRWRKVIRDLWDNKSQTILVVMSIAIGVFAFGGAFIAQVVTTADMSTQYQATNPANITMSVQSFDDYLVRWASNQDGVAEAQGRGVQTVQLVAEGDNIGLTLYAFDDYEAMQINTISPEEGEWPPERGEVLLERASVSLASAEIGDTILVELSDGDQEELVFAGTAHDLCARPGNLMQQQLAT